MGWASKHIERLQKGETVSFRPHGNSMTPRIHSGQLVTVSPKIEDVGVGDVVLCRCNGKQYCHLVTAIRGDRFQISNNHGHVNGWVGRPAIFGKIIRVE